MHVLLLLVVSLWLCLVFCGTVDAETFCGFVRAETVHVLGGSFGSAGSGLGEFVDPRGVAVDDSTELSRVAAGDVYVVDEGGDRVERFSGSGVYLGQFDGSGTFEVEGKVEAGKAAPSGSFSEPTQIAVDNSGSLSDPSRGDVYVVDSGHGVIDKFSETGAYLSQITGAKCEVSTEEPPCSKSKLEPFAVGESGINGVAVDRSGSLWADEFPGSVYEFSDGNLNTYVLVVTVTSGLKVLGVGPEGDLYIKEGLSKNIKVSSTDGSILVNPFGIEESTFGVAVDSVAGRVYFDYGMSVGAFGFDGTELERFGSGDLQAGVFGQASQGVAVNQSDGVVYASDFADGDVVFFDAVSLPTVVVGGLSGQSPRGVTLNGTVNPEGSPVTSCEFEYVPVGEYEPEGSDPFVNAHSVECSPSAGGLGSGSSPVGVSRVLGGLVPESEYVYRLVAENSTGVPSMTLPQKFFTGPVLGGAYASRVTSESATLNVPVDPNGDDTHYYFEYGTSTGYGMQVPVSAPGVDIGSVSGVQGLSVHLQSGLLSGTVYHYRVVVLQGGEEFFEPDRRFLTQRVSSGGVLPDGREWELVSPADKKGALIEQFSNGVGDDIQAASNGSGITYLTAGPSVGTGAQGKINWAQTLSVRSPNGWASSDLSLPRHVPGNEEPAASDEAREEYDVFSSDLSLGILEPSIVSVALAAGVPEHRTIYLRNNQTGEYVPLVSDGNVESQEELVWGTKSDEQLYFVTATSDMSHVLLASPHAFTPDATYESSYLPVDQWNLYEWSGGRLQLVNVLPAGEGGSATHSLQPSVRLAGGAVSEGTPSGVNPSAVSGDGRRVAWDLGVPNAPSGGYVGLFVRDMVLGSTVKVAGSNSVFQWMSSDGSRVFYLENNDLHVCELVESEGELSCKYSDLTADHGVSETGGVQSLVSDVSSDGSYVYFVSKSVMTGTTGVSGMPNLYLLHDASGTWRTSLVATLGPEDEKTWDETVGGGSPPDLSRVSSRVSSDGRFLVFMSDRSLTGFDNSDVFSGRRDEEVFLFDAQADGGAGSLACVSCDPSGGRPVGVADVKHSSLLVDRQEGWAGSSLAGVVPGWDRDFVEGSEYQSRFLSDSGRVFFDSSDGLVPHASNGVMDVYEFEPVGVGGCTSSVASGTMVFVGSDDGCVGLISSGISGQESAFFDASTSGDDVFFITAAKLVSADYDRGYDVYDAHVCGSEGVACVAGPVALPACSSGDACKGAPPLQPEIFGPTPSMTFAGNGNFVEEPVSKVSKPKAKKPKAKKHKRKKGKGVKGKKGKGRKSSVRVVGGRAGVRVRVGG